MEVDYGENCLIWAENRADSLLKSELKNRLRLIRDVYIALIFVAVAMATSCAAGIIFRDLNLDKSRAESLFLLATYLAAVLAYGVIRCLRVGDVDSPPTVPVDLLTSIDCSSLEVVRRSEIVATQNRIARTVAENIELAARLRRLHNAVILMPLFYSTVS